MGTVQIERLEFSTNWNKKLDCDVFTTLRISGRFKIGQVVEVWEKKTFRGAYRIVDKKKLTNITMINDWVGYLDTGYNGKETQQIIQRMYPKITNWDYQPIYYYLVQKVK